MPRSRKSRPASAGSPDSHRRNIRRNYPRWLLCSAGGTGRGRHVINLGPTGRHGRRREAAPSAPGHVYSAAFALLSVLLEVFMGYSKYVAVLKCSAYRCWPMPHRSSSASPGRSGTLHIRPAYHWKAEYFVTVVAVFGTTISPYLFFWQAEEEVEDQQEHRRRTLAQAPEQAARNPAHRNRYVFAWGYPTSSRCSSSSPRLPP